MATETRPTLDATLSGRELMRWYWLREELAAFARQLGISASGNKEALQERIAAHLDGRPKPAEPPRKQAGTQLTGPLSEATIVARGQRCSQHLRNWFESRLGAGFRFDAPMRQWFAETDGTEALGDALAHWQATRGRSSEEIGRQFELNRFTRAWHAAHPDGSREQLLDAWRQYRSLPEDARDRA